MSEQKLRVWWMPRVPGKCFYRNVDNIFEAQVTLEILGLYDLFLESQEIVHQYGNAGGLEVYITEESGDVEYPGWFEWYNDEDDDIYSVDENGVSP